MVARKSQRRSGGRKERMGKRKKEARKKLHMKETISIVRFNFWIYL